MSHLLIRTYYACFNERRFTAAAELFANDAVLDHPPFAKQQRGGDAYVRLAEHWVTAFPDAQLAIDRVEQRGDTICEVDLTSTGTHLGPLTLGEYGVFKPTGLSARLRVRELLEVRVGRITFSSISFDVNEFIRQLQAAPES